MSEAANGNLVVKKQNLYLTIHEATGLSKDETPIWDDDFKEGYVRVEVRGGQKPTKVSTFTQSVDNNGITWRQELRVELTDTSKELRIMLCKDKPKDGSGSKKGTSVVAACGIFVKDILEAVPIDKFFELFKPGAQESSLGGYIRVTLRTGPPGPSMDTLNEEVQNIDEGNANDVENVVEHNHGKGGTMIRILLLAGVAATITAIKLTHNRKS